MHPDSQRHTHQQQYTLCARCLCVSVCVCVHSAEYNSSSSTSSKDMRQWKKQNHVARALASSMREIPVKLISHTQGHIVRDVEALRPTKQHTQTHRERTQCRDALVWRDGGIHSDSLHKRGRLDSSGESFVRREQQHLPPPPFLESALYLCTVPKPVRSNQPGSQATAYQQHQQHQLHLPGRQSENTCPPACLPTQRRQQAHVVYAPDAHTTKPLDRRCPSSLPERLSQQKIWI